MGGKVLELESERLKAEGLQEGMIAGAIKTCRPGSCYWKCDGRVFLIQRRCQ